MAKHPLVKDLNLVDLVRLYQPELEQRGNWYIGKCVFHEESNASMNVNSEVFNCFGCGKKGDAIDFLKYLGNSYPEALNILQGDVTNLVVSTAKEVIVKDGWKRIEPRQEYNIAKLEHYELGAPSWVYTYRNPDGKLFGYVCRWQTESGKQVRPYVYAENGNCRRWRWQGFGTDIPPYLIETVSDEDKWVVVVEGEKACEALRYQLDIPVVSWALGTSSVKKTNWELLGKVPRNYIFWADNDAVGQKAIEYIKSRLKCLKSYAVDCREEIRGFDAADIDWDSMDAGKYIKSRLVKLA